MPSKHGRWLIAVARRRHVSHIRSIDFGLTLLARLAGEDDARGWQLGTEYDPHPPFDLGTPDKAGQFIEGEVMRVLGPRVENVRASLAGTPRYVGE